MPQTPASEACSQRVHAGGDTLPALRLALNSEKPGAGSLPLQGRRPDWTYRSFCSTKQRQKKPPESAYGIEKSRNRTELHLGNKLACQIDGKNRARQGPRPDRLCVPKRLKSLAPTRRWARHPALLGGGTGGW